MKQGQPEVFDRLDQAYACWEEEMWRTKIRRFFQESAEPEYKPTAVEFGFPIDGAHRTKKLLLQAVSKENLDYLLPAARKKFAMKPEVSHEEIESRREVVRQDIKEMNREKRWWTKERFTEEQYAHVMWEEVHFPYYLGRWSSMSRRIFFLPEDLVLQFQATTFKGMTFRDIRLPFECFGIALESPITSREGRELDFFLVGDLSRDCIALYGLSRSLAKWRPIDPKRRAKIDEAINKKNFRRFVTLAGKEVGRFGLRDYWEPSVQNHSLTEEEMDEDLSTALSSSATRLESYGGEVWLDQYFRILVGLCFYLQSFGPSYSGIVEPLSVSTKPRAGAKDGPALVDAADVCKIQSVVQLNAADKQILRDQLSGRGGWEVKAHFREGYWRRPKGEGHNPAAAKTVWVRPTLVRRDRLPKNALPHGLGAVFP